MQICKILDELAPNKLNGLNSFSKLITYVQDRPGHDVRYAIDASKIKKHLGWSQKKILIQALKKQWSGISTILNGVKIFMMVLTSSNVWGLN
jgi:dTDP-glucose 4,6-dehydratase